MRVLMIEDDKDLVKVVSNFLCQDGHVVCSADNLGNAMSLISCGDPEVVIVDLGLKDTHGTETLESVIDMLDEDVAIVVFSGHQMWTEECLRLGADEFLLKGEVGTSEISDALRRAKGHRKLSVALSKEPEDLTFSGREFPDTDKIGRDMASTAEMLRGLAHG